jgi:micrococcal nuclease
MQILITVALWSVVAIQTPAPFARITRSDPVLVRTVIDGDTIDVATIGRVRLLGIDAPEIRRGDERLTSLLLHRWVRLEHEGAALDAYHRRLAYVMTEDGQFVNALLVREGLARVSARVPLTRLRELQQAEAHAQELRRGMWGRSPSIPPPSYNRPSKTSRPTTSRSKTPASQRRKTHAKKP